MIIFIFWKSLHLDLFQPQPSQFPISCKSCAPSGRSSSSRKSSASSCRRLARNAAAPRQRGAGQVGERKVKAARRQATNTKQRLTFKCVVRIRNESKSKGEQKKVMVLKGKCKVSSRSLQNLVRKNDDDDDDDEDEVVKKYQ